MSFAVFASSDEFTPVEDEKNNSSDLSSEGNVGTALKRKCAVTKSCSVVHRGEEEQEEKV